MNKPATPRLPVRITKCEGGKRLALVNKDGGLISYIDVAATAYAQYIVAACNDRPRLVVALREQLEAYMGEFGPDHIATRHRALLRELGEIE